MSSASAPQNPAHASTGASPSPRKSLLFSFPVPVQWALCALVAILFTALMIQARGTTRPSAEPEPLLLEPLDLNAVSKEELRLLPGVGEKLAQRIVEYRRLKGSFRDIDELRKVPGIGPITLSRLRDWLKVKEVPKAESGEVLVTSVSTAPEQAALTMKPPLAKSKLELAQGKVININTAKAEDLRQLPGIGPKLSQYIIDARLENGPFASVDDLRKVKGIGKKTLEKIRPFVTIGGSVVQ